MGTVNLPINVAKALEYILKDQNKQTGSFGNPVLTSFVLPTLTGRSVLDVRSMSCPGLVVWRCLIGPNITDCLYFHS